MMELSYLFLVCGDHKGMPKMYSKVNSLLCCASLLYGYLISRGLNFRGYLLSMKIITFHE